MTIVSVYKKSEKFLLIRYCPPERVLPMRVSDSSIGSEAGQFHTACWMLVTAPDYLSVETQSARRLERVGKFFPSARFSLPKDG